MSPQAGPHFVVVYDEGSASPLEIARGLKALGTVHFTVANSPHVHQAMPLLRQYGDVTMLDDVLQREAAWPGEHPDAVVTFSERMLPQTSCLTDRLGLIGHSLDTVRALTDKVEQRRLLRRAGVEAIRYRAFDDPADLADAISDVGFPVVVKPAHGEGSRCTYPVESADDIVKIESVLAEQATSAPFIVEEFLQGRTENGVGDYVSVESVVVDGRPHHLAVTGKFPLAAPFRETGMFWPTHLQPQEAEQMEQLTSAALDALGVRWGICHTEIKLTASGPRLIEVNGRLGGFIGELAHRSVGLDLIQVAGMVALGQHPRLTAIELDQVYFQHHHPAPLFPCTFDGILGAKDVEQMPGVHSYRLMVRPGTALASSVSSVRLDALYGRAKSHADMISLAEAASDRLRFSFTETGVGGSQVRREIIGRQLTQVSLSTETV